MEDEADLEAQLAALQAALPKIPAKPKAASRRPRRQALPATAHALGTAQHSAQGKRAHVMHKGWLAAVTPASVQGRLTGSRSMASGLPTGLTASGRQREYAVFGCSRSAEVLARSKLATCERLLSLSLNFSAA